MNTGQLSTKTKKSFFSKILTTSSSYLIRNRLVIILTILSYVLVHGPDIIIWFLTPQDKLFSGFASWFDPWDQSVYISAIEWGRQGHFLYRNQFDSVSRETLPIYTAYTFLGITLGKLIPSNVVIFHIASLFTTAWFVYACKWFIDKILPNKFSFKDISLILIILGSGVGWLFRPVFLIPDISLPHITNYVALRNPHDAISLVSFLIVIGLTWQIFFQKSRPGQTIKLILACLMLLLIHPFMAAPVLAIIFSWSVIRYIKKGLLRASLKPLILVGSSIALYMCGIGYFLLTSQNFAGLVHESLHSPSIWKLLVSVILYIPFIYIAWNKKLTETTVQYLFVWLAVQLVLFWFPASWQRLVIRGAWFPTIMLTMYGWSYLINTSKLNIRWLYVWLLVCCINPIFIFYFVTTNRDKSAWIYLPLSYESAFQYLRQQSQSDASVLALMHFGNLVPHMAGMRTYLGHEHVTPNFPDRANHVVKFYSGKYTQQDARNFLIDNQITWIFWGPEEQQTSGLPSFPYPELVDKQIDTDTSDLYKVKNSGN